MALAGAVQNDIERQDQCRCDMILQILGSTSQYPISANLGRFSQGCQLDIGALENAAWEVICPSSSTTSPSLDNYAKLLDSVSGLIESREANADFG